MQLAQLRAELVPLEERSDSDALLVKAAALLPLVPDPSAEAAYLLYAIGKALVGLNRTDEALGPLQRSLEIDTGRAHGHYLLGYCLARAGQWPAALLAQQRSCGLDPRQADSWYEQGRAALELGQDRLAEAALARALQRRAGWQAALALLHHARVRVALDQGAESGAAAIQAALAQGPLPQWLLQAWCAHAGAVLLAGAFAAARPLLAALTQRSTAGAASSAGAAGIQALPRRPALLLALVLELLPGGDQQAARGLASELRDTLWQPPSAGEQALWQPVLEPALRLLLGRASSRLQTFEPGWLLLRCIPAVVPPAVCTRELEAAIAARLPEPSHNPFSPFARRIRSGHGDLTSSLDWLPEAIEAGRQWLLDCPADAEVRHLLDRHLQSLSQQMLDGPGRLVALPGQNATALDLRRRAAEALVEASDAIAMLDQQPPVRQRLGERRRWLLLASRDLPQCVLYRVEQKQDQLQRLGCQAQVLWLEQLASWTFTRSLLWAEAVVVCRLPAIHPVLRTMAAARRFGRSVYYDLDDLLFDPELCPPPLATYGGTVSPAQHRALALDVPLHAAAMARSDGLIVSTTSLARRWRELQPAWRRPVWILPNLAPAALWSRASRPGAPQAAPLRLVFASGTTAHKQAWQEELAPALARLLARHRSLRLDLLGHVAIPQPLLAFAERIQCLPYTDYPRYLHQLAQASIGLVVLEPGTFTDAKSAIRWMEFSLLGLPSVLSPTATYTEILQPDRDVLFARGMEQWEQQIERLIDDPALRQALATRAHARARELFAPSRADASWLPLIDPLASAGRPAPPRRRRLLVINVFFAPQSLGGATRVAQDQVLQLLERAGDRFEVTVLCADHQPWQLPPAAADDGSIAEPADGDDHPLAIDCHDWHGARVVRVALPSRFWIKVESAAMAAFCRQWFASEGFDLIHAHCLQMLTLAPLQVAAELGIPYVVSLHDGWWLSPQQFLTTVTGQPIDPADPLGHLEQGVSRPADSLAAAHQRRQLLAQVLAAASARLAVSSAFAAVYRRGGVADISVVENDWQPMATHQRRRRRSAGERLRLCFVGGQAVHKGYAVLQAALFLRSLAGEGAGASLTVIDATLPPGRSDALDWNGTPVRWVPAVPMDAMAAFYADHDVLLAPSIWPESFGLVTREALSAGLWVVASDIGALAEPIRPGLNGSLVPPGDAAALAAILCQLCREHPQPQPCADAPAPRAIEQLLPLYERCIQQNVRAKGALGAQSNP